MTSTRGEQDFAQVWLAFVQAIQELLDMARQRTDQPQLTPYEGWEGEVLTATRDNQLVQGLQLRWQNLQWDSPVTANLLLQELRLFPGVVERIRDRIWHGRSRLKLPLIRRDWGASSISSSICRSQSRARSRFSRSCSTS